MRPRTIIGRAVFLRHGESDYTDIFPDLTKAGKRTILNSAYGIKAIVNHRPCRVEITSSPAIRALGSADIISNVLRFAKEVRQTSLLAPARIKDAARGKALFDEHVSNGGIRRLCIAYGTDPRYEDGEVIEPRSQVQKRFYKYLGMLARNMLASDSKNHFVVHVSHYEVLYNLVETVFWLNYEDDSPLWYGEVILISFYDTGHDEVVEMDVVFRRKTAEGVIFCHKEGKIVAGP